VPFFDDFRLEPDRFSGSDEELINLQWRQRDSDYPFWPSQLSDGTLRFICLATALLQPDPPSTIIIDEPEIGLHPYALSLLGALLREASHRMQVVVCTQSAQLVNEFTVEDLVVVEREEGASVFRRYDEAQFREWLEEYSTGELWQKNLLGGTPGG
jgi:predicted ATPase